MSYSTLDYQVDKGILTLSLNRPEQMNAFTVEMCEELVDAFTRASNDDAVRAVVVTGSGKAFCAGMDLSKPGNVFGLDETQQPTLEDMFERFDDPAIFNGVRDTGGRVTLSIFNCAKPTIAAINGAAVGIGATMPLAIDFRMCFAKGAHRLRVHQARHRARGLLDLVPAAHRRHHASARVDVQRRDFRCAGSVARRSGASGVRA